MYYHKTTFLLIDNDQLYLGVDVNRNTTKHIGQDSVTRGPVIVTHTCGHTLNIIKNKIISVIYISLVQLGLIRFYQLHQVLYCNNTGTSRAIDSPRLMITANW